MRRNKVSQTLIHFQDVQGNERLKNKMSFKFLKMHQALKSAPPFSSVYRSTFLFLGQEKTTPYGEKLYFKVPKVRIVKPKKIAVPMYECYKLSTVNDILSTVNVLRPKSVSEHAHISSGHACAPVYYDNKLTVLHLPSPHSLNKILI